MAVAANCAGDLHFRRFLFSASRAEPCAQPEWHRSRRGWRFSGGNRAHLFMADKIEQNLIGNAGTPECRSREPNYERNQTGEVAFFSPSVSVHDVGKSRCRVFI